MMLWCVGSRTETAKIKEIAKEIDLTSFIVISNAREAWKKSLDKITNKYQSVR